jgi:hypothetical protein
MFVRISIANHAPGGTFMSPVGAIRTDENGHAWVNDQQRAWLQTQGHINVVPVTEADVNAEAPPVAESEVEVAPAVEAPEPVAPVKEAPSPEPAAD